eukprot:3938942-Rhodomonas_salina.5
MANCDSAVTAGRLCTSIRTDAGAKRETSAGTGAPTISGLGAGIKTKENGRPILPICSTGLRAPASFAVALAAIPNRTYGVLATTSRGVRGFTSSTKGTGDVNSRENEVFFNWHGALAQGVNHTLAVPTNSEISSKDSHVEP